MSEDLDVIIIGSGPAGVSAAFPLVQSGLKVLMIDAGHQQEFLPPARPFLTERYESEEQWKWLIGEDFYALKNIGAVSPKLRTPIHRYVFEGFAQENYIESENFITVGSLAKGGLSNAWGCGVARLSARELESYPFDEKAILESYETVTRRMGVSGGKDDDLSSYFGLDDWSQPALPIDELHKNILQKYSKKRTKLLASGFSLGRSRIAALSSDFDGRSSCDVSGNCLWGCHRKSLYTSAYDLDKLIEFDNFSYRPGYVVQDIISQEHGAQIKGKIDGSYSSLSAKNVIMAAGTIATTRIALRALRLERPVQLQSCPTAAFILWLPRLLGRPRVNSIGLGQLSFALELKNSISVFGSTFSTTGILMAEFIRHMPISKRYAIDMLKQLMKSCLVGNVFLPGKLSTTKAFLKSDGMLKIHGGNSEQVDSLMIEAAGHLRKSYRKLGAFMLPTSFTQSGPGSDIHYSCSLPMRYDPKPGETYPDGKLAGLSNVYVVDGACLSELTEKSHTLTIMANADRIGRLLAEKIMME